MKNLSSGHQPFGDQIPWKFCEQFREANFPSLSGARIVRIATHPSAMKVMHSLYFISVLIRLCKAFVIVQFHCCSLDMGRKQ